MDNSTAPKTDNSKTQDITEGTPVLSRVEVLAKLAACIIFVHDKIHKGRARKTDKAKESMLKTQGYLTGIYLSGLKDHELDEIKERIAKLEQERSGKT